MSRRPVFVASASLFLLVTSFGWGDTKPRFSAEGRRKLIKHRSKGTVAKLKALEYFWVTPADFRPRSDEQTGRLEIGRDAFTYKIEDFRLLGVNNKMPCGVTAGPPELVAPVHIPRGATIREFRVTISDSCPKMHAVVGLSRARFSPDGKPHSKVTLRTANSAGKNGETIFRASELTVTREANDYYFLTINFHRRLGVRDGAAVAVSAVRLAYTLDE